MDPRTEARIKRIKPFGDIEAIGTFVAHQLDGAELPTGSFCRRNMEVNPGAPALYFDHRLAARAIALVVEHAVQELARGNCTDPANLKATVSSIKDSVLEELAPTPTLETIYREIERALEAHRSEQA